MAETVNIDVTTLEESVSVTTTDGGTVEVAVQAEKGDAATITVGTTTTGNAGTNASVTNSGTTSAAVFNFTIPRGAAGPNTVTSATTSDGTGDLSLSNVTTATATVTGTLTASHIHGNLAGSVYAHVRAGENLTKGDPVYISGSHGSGASLIAIVSKADASNAAKMPVVGVMDADVTANSNGHMVITGTITELDTNAFAVNAELYVAAGGGFTSTPPTTLCQPVARVERSNTNNGAVIVKVNGLSSKSAIDNTLVRRGANGDVSFATSANDTITLNLESNGDFVGVVYPSAVKALASGSLGIGADIYSNSGWGAVITSNTNTGALISTNSGTYHAEFGSGDNRFAIERVRGWFVWFYNTFTGRIKTANITANRDWTLPDASGTIALTTSNVATATALETSRNIFGIAFNGTSNVSGDATNAGHFASIPTGGQAGHFITLNGTAPTVIAGRSAWWSDASGNPSFRNGTGTAVTLVRSSDLGTGVATALAVNVGSAGAFVVNGGALGTPTSGTLTSCTGLPISTGVSGLASGIATFLATPSSANLAAALTDENGTGGGFVRAESPTLTTPTIATGTNYATQAAAAASRVSLGVGYMMIPFARVHAFHFLYNGSSQTTNRYWQAQNNFGNNAPAASANFTKGTRGEIIASGQSWTMTNIFASNNLDLPMTCLWLARPTAEQNNVGKLRVRGYNFCYNPTQEVAAFMQATDTNFYKVATLTSANTEFVCMGWSGDLTRTRAAIWNGTNGSTGSLAFGFASGNSANENFGVGSGQGGASGGIEFVAAVFMYGFVDTTTLLEMCKDFYRANIA